MAKRRSRRARSRAERQSIAASCEILDPRSERRFRELSAEEMRRAARVRADTQPGLMQGHDNVFSRLAGLEPRGPEPAHPQEGQVIARRVSTIDRSCPLSRRTDAAPGTIVPVTSIRNPKGYTLLTGTRGTGARISDHYRTHTGNPGVTRR